MGVESVEAGITLAEWFYAEGERIYALLREDEQGRERRRLVALLRAKGGAVTVRQLMRVSRRYRTAKAAEAALEALVDEGLGEWVLLPTQERGSKGQRAFRLGGAGADGARGSRTNEQPDGAAAVPQGLEGRDGVGDVSAGGAVVSAGQGTAAPERRSAAAEQRAAPEQQADTVPEQRAYAAPLAAAGAMGDAVGGVGRSEDAKWGEDAG